MVKLNRHFEKISENYLFREIERRVALKTRGKLFNLGIGDISLPLAKSVVEAICKATIAMGKKESFKGYGPANGYPFLKEIIAQKEYKNLVDQEEIFIYNGSKDALAAIEEIFEQKASVALMNPTYPVYLNTNLMRGRKINYLPCIAKNSFIPQIPTKKFDLIYLCSPNNPTGAVLNREELKKWIDFAIKNDSIILLDSAYKSFSNEENVYTIEGSKKVVIEFRSFSKDAGFTNLRCSYIVIPHDMEKIKKLWIQRINSKFGGIPYPIQMGAAAIYSEQGKKEVEEQINAYKKRAKILADGLANLGFFISGGYNSPFVFCKTKKGFTSWQFFDLLLEKAGIICVPGSGFGKCGEGFVRFSAFAEEEAIYEALNFLKNI